MFINRNLGNDKCAYSDAVVLRKFNFDFQGKKSPYKCRFLHWVITAIANKTFFSFFLQIIVD
jgi:hypothetical protein